MIFNRKVFFSKTYRFWNGSSSKILTDHQTLCRFIVKLDQKPNDIQVIFLSFGFLFFLMWNFFFSVYPKAQR